MKLTFAAMALAGAFCASLIAQSTPTFDVASIKPSTEQASGSVAAGLHLAGSQMRVVGLSLKDYVGIAYSLRPSQVVALDWMSTARFDISANLPDGVPQDQVPAMLRNLLETRFALKAHREQRDFPIYAITVAKTGLKVTPVPEDPNAPPPTAIDVGGGGSSAGVALNLGNGTTFTLANGKIEATKMTMVQLAEALTRFTDRPVRDATGISGRFDVTVTLTPEEYQSTLIRSGVNAGAVLPPQVLRLMDTGPANPLGPALEQVGLTFDARKAPLDVVVVDSMAKTPTGN